MSIRAEADPSLSL